jgi:alpha-L-fucosidase
MPRQIRFRALATLATVAVLSLGLLSAPASAAPGDNYAVDDPFTSQRTQWWRDSAFGMFIHFGTYAQWGGEYKKPDGSVCRNGNAEWILERCKIPMNQYEASAKKFNPASFDAAAIVKLAKDAGQKYIVITSKHHDGYAMWPTKVNKWNLRDHSSFDKNRDILAELKAEGDKQGVKLGLYYSILDWHNPNYANNMPKYRQEMNAQLKELVDSYKPAVLWFDGQWGKWTAPEGEALESYVRGLDPTVIINNRVGKKRITDGDYGTPEQMIPGAPVDGQPWESCMTINKSWGYTNWNNEWKSTTELTRNLINIAGRGGNYLLNIGPDPAGRVPQPSVDRLRGMGAWLAANGQGAAVYNARYPGLVAPPSWGAASLASGGKLYLSVYSWPGAGKPLHLKALDPFTITGARVLGSDQAVTWKAAGDGYDITPSGSSTNSLATVIELSISTTAPQAGSGTGLRAQYWDNPSFSGTAKVTRTDPTLNFAWRAKGSPAAGIPTDNFSARWTGFVQPEYTDTYTFLTVSDDTVKVWIDGKVVIDNTSPHEGAVNKATVSLQAGKQYSIRVDHTDRGGEAHLKLLWASPNVGQQIVPASQLYPPAALTTDGE